MPRRKNNEEIKRMRTNQISMTKGPLLGKMLLFALPLAASSVLQLLFNMADVVVVGRFAGSNALAAVGGTTQVINLMVNLFIGLSVGTNVVLATLIGQGQDRSLPEVVHTAMGIALVSFSLIITCLVHENGPLRLEVRQIRIYPAAARRILAIGIPAGLQSVVFSLANVCIQTGVNSFGAACVAGSSAANNFESLTYTTVNAFGQAAVTFTGQNYGARQYGRCKRVALLAWLASLSVSLTMNGCFYLVRGRLLQIYTTDPAVIAYGMQRISCSLRFQFLMTPYEILAGSLRGMGHSSLPAALTVLGTCVLRLMWVYTVFAGWHEFWVLMLAYPVSWVLTSALMLAAWLRVGRRTLSEASASGRSRGGRKRLLPNSSTQNESPCRKSWRTERTAQHGIRFPKADPVRAARFSNSVLS